MKILVRAARILDPASPFDGQTKSLLIEDGLITRIADGIAVPDGAAVVAHENLHASPGWLDMRVSVPDPGHEHRETLHSAREAAAAGGFTQIAVLPNTHPTVQTKESVAYLVAGNRNHAVQIHAVAAVTLGTHGKELTDMIDLHHAGAVAFSDGHAPLQNPDLVLKVLQYLQPFGGLFISRPEDTLLSRFGTMHEGLAATMLGMKGMPAMAESMMVMRDLRILEYTGGRIHFSCLSSAESVELVRQAKKRGLRVTCDMAAHQIAFTDNDLMQFDTHLKTNPPFRSQADIDALWAGLADGTIDAVVSDHHPLDAEVKNLEFDLADFGLIGLETAFAVILTHNKNLPLEKIVSFFSTKPRQILNLPAPPIAEGQPANLTLFDPEAEWVFDGMHIRSKSGNTPFVGQRLKGRVVGIVNRNRMEIAATAGSAIRNPKFQ